VKDLYELMLELEQVSSLSERQKAAAENLGVLEEPGITIIDEISYKEEEAMGDSFAFLVDEYALPKYDSEVDLLSPKIGKTQIEEYQIRKNLLKYARDKNSKMYKKATEILKKVYSLEIIN
jgi:predicted metal-dependent hydrolase